MSAEHIKRMWQANPERVAGAFAKVLADFGYPVDQVYVKGELQRLYDGGTPRGGPSMFLARWIKNGIET